MKFLLLVAGLLTCVNNIVKPALPGKKFEDFKIRTITAGINLEDLTDTTSVIEAIDFLNNAKDRFTRVGYEVQTIRIATQSMHQLNSGIWNDKVIDHIKVIDRIAQKNNVQISIGELIEGNQEVPFLENWVVKLSQTTTNINCSIPISSQSLGIHEKSIRTAARICKALSMNSSGGEANFRFTASANCPPGIPFFPAAFHEGPPSFALGMESPNLLTKVFTQSDWTNARLNLKNALEAALMPIEIIGKQISKETDWMYDGIDTSPAPGLNASIGTAIEALTQLPFGSPTTLSACALTTDVLKDLTVKTCGYSGLMLPVIEDKVLAKRAGENRFTVEELLLFSSVSGTGLDVVPIPGTTTSKEIEGIYRDVAALSLKYDDKALSARLFPIPGKKGGERIEFDNPYLTSSVVMSLN